MSKFHVGCALLLTLASACDEPADRGVGGGTLPTVRLDAGAPACATGTVNCGGRCTNLAVDLTNCGTCGIVCAHGQSCTAGKCVSATTCLKGQTNCGGTCTDTQTDASNCGSCGIACQPDETCQAGTCTAQVAGCPNGQMDCGAGCVDVSTDANNCGGCGVLCNANETCQAGACVGNANGGGGGGGTIPVSAGSASCSDTVTCINGCTTQACEQACLASATTTAQGLFNALTSCLFTKACPSTNGGVCDSTSKTYSQTRCSSCLSTAQGTGGQCASALTACINDMGGAPPAAMAGPYCASCAVDADCGAAGNYCLDDGNGGGFCGTVCKTNADCTVAGSDCEQIVNGRGRVIGSNCVPANGGTCPMNGNGGGGGGGGVVDAGVPPAHADMAVPRADMAVAKPDMAGGKPDLAMLCTPDTWTNWAKTWVDNNCTGCHTHSYGNNPSYASVKAEASSFYSRISSNNMPPGGGLGASDKARILAWLNCGAPQ